MLCILYLYLYTAFQNIWGEEDNTLIQQGYIKLI